MRKCALYRIVHRDTGKGYVGVSINYKRRWYDHKWDAKHRSSYAFHKALNKYGAEAFDWKVIAWSSFEGAKVLERIAIHLGLGYYNMTQGGDGILGFRHSEKSKRQMSEKSKNPSPEKRAAISAVHKGKKLQQYQKDAVGKASRNKSETHKNNLREHLKWARTLITRGPRSEQTKLKMSLSGKAAWVKRRAKSLEPKRVGQTDTFAHQVLPK
jgi:group I intron endonuclease